MTSGPVALTMVHDLTAALEVYGMRPASQNMPPHADDPGGGGTLGLATTLNLHNHRLGDR